MSKVQNTEERQLLRDPCVPPTDEVLAAALGGQYHAYQKFLAMLEGFGVAPEWRYYNDGKTWLGKGLYKWKSARGNEKAKTVFWLSIWEGFFKVSFFFSEKARVGLQDLAVGKNTKELIENAKQMGKLKFFPLVFDVRADVPDDLAVLVEYQKSLK